MEAQQIQTLTGSFEGHFPRAENRVGDHFVDANKMVRIRLGYAQTQGRTGV